MNGEDIRGKRIIVESEAKIVCRIFERFAAGLSPRAIARELNGDGIRGPSGKGWRDTTIRGHATRRTGILRNDLYAGRLVWNKQTYLRNPTSGKRVARVRDNNEIIAVDVPELRIVHPQVWDAVQTRLQALRASPGSRKQQSKEFWRHRRPKNLLTGLVHCGGCGGQMAAVGKDYLACSAARSAAGCANRKSIKRTRVEQAVLEGLKDRLMAPELVEEFIRAFHEEVNNQRRAEEARTAHHQAELGQVSKKLSGLYDAISDGLRTPGLKNELLKLEARQAELQQLTAAAPAAQPRFHPKLAEVYRATVGDLHAALSNPDARTEATEILRGLIDRVSVLTSANGDLIELTGNIVKLVTLPDGSVPSPFESSVKLVAGACNHLDLQLAQLLSAVIV